MGAGTLTTHPPVSASVATIVTSRSCVCLLPAVTHFAAAFGRKWLIT
jgi:hypothetical protein